jgi:hypothetical protein
VALAELAMHIATRAGVISFIVSVPVVFNWQ